MLHQEIWTNGSTHGFAHGLSQAHSLHNTHAATAQSTPAEESTLDSAPRFLVNPLLSEIGQQEIANDSGIWRLSRYSYLLIVVAFFAELFLPLLVWKTPLPGVTRWLADVSILVIAVLALARMLLFDQIPTGFLLILGATIVGSTVATFEGQTPLATAWGFWRMFMYPIVAFYAYLQPLWPAKIAARTFQLLVWLLGFEVFVQLAQYAAGQTPGDNLAGTFGWKGVGSLVMFVFLVLCLSFGKWLVSGSWRQLVVVVVLGLLASVFGEMKVYPAALVAIAGAAALIYVWRGGQVTTIFSAGIILVAALAGFLMLYNVVISEGRGVRPLEAYTNVDQVTKYLNNVNYNSDTGRYNLGRGFALTYGWEIIQRDTTTMLFGMGIGTRNESTSLGVVGQGLQDSLYGLTSGTSLLVMMQETGLVGLAVFALFAGWLIIVLLQDSGRDPDSDDTVLRYGIILFSLFWPLWLWYHRAWNFGPSMVLYWALVGYLLSQRPAFTKPDFRRLTDDEPLGDAAWGAADIFDQQGHDNIWNGNQR